MAGNHRMYILVRECIPIGYAINSVAHAAAAAMRKWGDDPDFMVWEEMSFRKVTCQVNDDELEQALKIEKLDSITISEKALEDIVCAVFKPRREWPELFGKLRLYNGS